MQPLHHSVTATILKLNIGNSCSIGNLLGPMGLTTIQGRFRPTVGTMAGEGNAADGHFHNSTLLTANRLRGVCKI
jgi:hypothetical protein